MADSSPLAHSPTLTATQPRGDGDRQLEAGAKVGDYVIERFIGAGAMGEVYAGRHPVIGKRVAIKVLRHELAASAEAAERFIREARAVNQIEHENVIDVFAFGRLDDGRLYLVMDLVEGRSLRAHLVDGPLELGLALEILDTVSTALDAAHAKGVVHRDLKPDNIVLSSATPPKVFVLDFGIAKLVSKANDADRKTGPGTLTGQGTWLGTPGYMAPEQWSVDGAGPASDRYALGVIAFELLAGTPPFSATSVPGMMEQHFRATVPALSSRGAVGVPPAVDQVLERALAKDPEARYPSARDFIEALRDAAGTGVHRARGAVAAPPSSKKLWMPAAAGAGVLGVAVVVVLGTRDHGTPSAKHDGPAVQPGQVAIDIRSEPSGADVTTDHVVGQTPTKLALTPGSDVRVTVSKPGYVAQTRALHAGPSGTVADFTLDAPMRFTQGAWRLKNGELREFKRTDDQVDVYKLREVTGHGEFFKHYKFTRADTGIAFAADDEVVDSRAPDDPHCHVPVRVEYQYDQERDVLALRREKVTIDFKNGSCIVRAREIESDELLHIGDAEDTVEIPAPVGVPLTKESPKPKKVVPLDPQKEITRKAAERAALKKADEQKTAAIKKSNVTKKKPVSDTSSYGGKQQDIFSAKTNSPNIDDGKMANAAPPQETGQQAPQQAQQAPPQPPRQALPPQQAVAPPTKQKK